MVFIEKKDNTIGWAFEVRADRVFFEPNRTSAIIRLGATLKIFAFYRGYDHSTERCSIS
jgi:hypothetical protein